MDLTFAVKTLNIILMRKKIMQPLKGTFTKIQIKKYTDFHMLTRNVSRF